VGTGGAIFSVALLGRRLRVFQILVFFVVPLLEKPGVQEVDEPFTLLSLQIRVSRPYICKASAHWSIAGTTFHSCFEHRMAIVNIQRCPAGKVVILWIGRDDVVPCHFHLLLAQSQRLDYLSIEDGPFNGAQSKFTQKVLKFPILQGDFWVRGPWVLLCHRRSAFPWGRGGFLGLVGSHEISLFEGLMKGN